MNLTIRLTEQQFQELKAILNPELKLIPEIVFDLKHFKANRRTLIKDLYDHYGTIEFSYNSSKVRDIMVKNEIYGNPVQVLEPIVGRGILSCRSEMGRKFYRFQ